MYQLNLQDVYGVTEKYNLNSESNKVGNIKNQLIKKLESEGKKKKKMEPKLLKIKLI
jgi:hypothetical protein